MTFIKKLISNTSRLNILTSYSRRLQTSCRSFNNIYSSVSEEKPKQEQLAKKEKRNSENFKLSLSKPLENFPDVEYATNSNESFETKSTKLSNGLTVATQPIYGNFCTVGVLVNAGSRYEVSYPSGVSLLLERIAFTGSSLHKSKDEVLKAIENLNGIHDCQSSRDSMIYAASVSTEKVEGLVELIADSLFQPSLNDEDIQLAKMGIDFEIQDINLRPDPEPLMTETIHAAAFRGNTLGLPKYPDQQSMQQIDKEVLQTYLRSYYTPDRMVLAGVGVDHDALCELADKYFTDASKLPSWGLDGKIIKDDSLARYTGGEIRIEKESDLSMSVVPMPDLTHVSVGLESVNFKHEDFVPFAVINMLMGGGGSFSAGGPGKGMFSRLYLNVLNRHHYMYAATAFHHTYEDGGFFCIQASVSPDKLRECVDVICQELYNLTQGVGDIELSRAKKQLQSMLMMNLEARPVIFEDVGRQILATGIRKSPQQLCGLIEQVSNDDIVRVATNMIRSRPCLSAVGNLTNLPTLQEVESALTTNKRLTSRFRLFGR